MAKLNITKPNYPVDNIRQLPDQVKDQSSLLKETFDKVGTDTKEYLYDTLTEELNGVDGSKRIGHTSTSITSDNVGDALEENRLLIDSQSTDKADKTYVDAQDTNLQNQITSNDSDISSLETRMTTAEGNISSNDSDIALLQSRVTSNDNDIYNLQNEKVNKSTVLEKDNTTIYTPTGDYNPSTKKYVDDSIMNVVVDKLPENSVDDIFLDDNGVKRRLQELQESLTPSNNYVTITHNLGHYPIASLLSEGTYGVLGFGESLYGGIETRKNEIFKNIEHLSENSLELHTSMVIDGSMSVTKIDDYNYKISISSLENDLLLKLI